MNYLVSRELHAFIQRQQAYAQNSTGAWEDQLLTW